MTNLVYKQMIETQNDEIAHFIGWEKRHGGFWYVKLDIGYTPLKIFRLDFSNDLRFHKTLNDILPVIQNLTKIYKESLKNRIDFKPTTPREIFLEEQYDLLMHTWITGDMSVIYPLVYEIIKGLKKF